jgi:hypothetical protein
MMFENYLRFDMPMNVYFGKRGVAAPALGVGGLKLQGVHGPMLLQDVLHVPKINVPLLSAMAAVRHGLSVHFWPAGHVGRTSLAVVLQHSQVVLTASPQGSLYFIDESGTTHAAAAPAVSGGGVPAIAHLDHARLGHIGYKYGTLADLCRQGVVVGEGYSPTAYLRARDLGVCQSCVEGKLGRISPATQATSCPHTAPPTHGPL